jgi:hypothetical protein
MRRFFFRTMNEPNDDSFTVSPFARVSAISPSTRSTTAEDFDRDSFTFS